MVMLIDECISDLFDSFGAVKGARGFFFGHSRRFLCNIHMHNVEERGGMCT